MSSPSEPLAHAYAACVALARSHYENFPVASWLLPSPMRPHVAAVYAFARIADDMADEGEALAVERRSGLAAWGRRLHHEVARPQQSAAADRDSLVIAATAHTVRTLDLPLTLFDDLLSAFAQDTSVSRYESWGALFDYCRRSANPIGRLVLRIAGHHDARLDRSSDAFCTALQLTNFWQDLGRDWDAGRLYVPREEQARCGAEESDLDAARLTTAWAETIARCVARTRRCFEEGRDVCDGVGGRLRFELRLTWHGGRRILDRVEQAGPDLLHARPALTRTDLPALLWRALRWEGATA